MEFEESFLEESCHTTAAHSPWREEPPSIQVELHSSLRDSRRLGSGTPGVWMLLGRRDRWGAAWGRASFGGKSTIEVLKLKGITIILPCGQHAWETLFCRSAPKRKWRAQSRVSQKGACMPWDVEKVKNSQPELGWFPHIRKTTGIRQPRDSVHRVCVCGGGRGWCELPSYVQLFATLWTVAHQVPLSMEFSRQNTGVDCHFLLQGIFLTQALNPSLLHCRQILYRLSHQGSPLGSTLNICQILDHHCRARQIRTSRSPDLSFVSRLSLWRSLC